MSEPTYPQHTIILRWEQDDVQNQKYPRDYEGLPEGRIRNCVSLNRMYREIRTEGEIYLWALDEWWPLYVAEKLADLNPSVPTVTIKDKGRETWILSWFEHWTFDYGQTDAEAIASFRAYVDRYAHMQDWAMDWRDKPEYRCLMGAEDRWRWKGEGDGPAPCRCVHCVKQGVIRIGH